MGVVRLRARKLRLTTALVAAALLATAFLRPVGAVEGPVEVVYVANGLNFPDALAGSVLAALDGAPLLMVRPDPPLPAATDAMLASLQPDRIVVFGGPAAVSDAVLQLLVAHARSGEVTRLEGEDRFDTARKIAAALPNLRDADTLQGLGADAFLPADGRAADADKLDGLDSTDFLRSDGKAADSARLDGFDHATLRHAMIPVRGVLQGGAVESSQGVSFPGTGTSAVHWNFFVPPDHTPGDPMVVDFMIGTGIHNCDFRLSTTSLVAKHGNAAVVAAGWFAEGNTSAAATYHLDTQIQTFSVQLATEGDDDPGTAHVFRLSRSGDHAEDNCTGFVILAAHLRY